MQRFVISSLLMAAGALAQDDFICPDEFEGYYPHDLSCDKYWECKSGLATLETCGNGLAFDDLDPSYTTKNCDYLYNVGCGARNRIEEPISAQNCPRLYGTFSDPDDCTGFYNCRDGLSNRFSCAPGLAYDPTTRVCKWADQVNACKAEKAQEEADGGVVFSCPNDVPVGIYGKHAHPEDCRQYFVCISGDPREYGCPLGTVFKIGGTYDGKCTSPEEVPECSNYYGDLDFDKQELVKAGVDPEAVGITLNASPRVRVNRPLPRASAPVARPIPASFDIDEDEDEDDFILPARTIQATSSDSFRSRARNNRPRPVAPVPAAPQTPSVPVPRPQPVRAQPARVAPPIPNRSRPRVALPEPINASPAPVSPPAPIRASPRPSFVPVQSVRTNNSPVPAPRREVPAIPLSSIATEERPSLLSSGVPAGAVGGAAPGNLGQPAKVKAGEDYYYYYYYYDDDEEYPGDGSTGEDTAAAAVAAASAATA